MDLIQNLMKIKDIRLEKQKVVCNRLSMSCTKKIVCKSLLSVLFFEKFIRDIFISDTNYVLLLVNGRFISRLLYIKPQGISVVERIKDVV